MTETKQLSLSGRLRIAAACPDPNAPLLAEAALAIEQHEAFRQEVSDAVEEIAKRRGNQWLASALSRFIIAEPDPLVEVLNDLYPETSENREYANELHAALAARGLEIKEKQP